MKRALIPVALLVLTAALYLPRLGSAPIYLMPDEVIIGFDAYAIATSGHDAYHARFMPLYFQYSRLMVERSGRTTIRESWMPPIIFYAIAAALKVLPLSETSVRLPTAIVGILNVLLMYLVGRRLFKNDWLASLGAVLLALTPAHFIHSRMAADYLFPVPFVLAWLLCMLMFLDGKRPRALVAGTLCLGVGLYGYIGAVVAMPLYLLLTFVVLLQQRSPARLYALAAAGFLLPTLMALPWLLGHPEIIRHTLTKYDVGVEDQTALQGLRGLFTYYRIADQFGLYWGFFNPRLLFFEGPMEPMFSTRQVGVFLLPLAPLLVTGAVVMLRRSINPVTLLLLLGFLVAPLAATLVSVNDAIYRALTLLPFGVLLAVSGVRQLWSVRTANPGRRLFVVGGAVLVVVGGLYAARVLMTQSRIPGAAVPMVALGVITLILGLLADRMSLGQIAALGILAIVPIQFAYFYTDYFTDYRRRTALVFSGNIRGTYEEVIRQEGQGRVPAIYLAEIGSYGYGPLYWKFYLQKYGRRDLLERTTEGHYFKTDEVLKLPGGSLIVTNAGDGKTDAEIDRLVAAGQLKKTAAIKEPDGTTSYLVLQRVGP